MGCDIHCYMEIKNVNGDWQCDGIYRKSFDSESEKDFDLVPVYNNRNYELFSILANVRNDGKIVPISKPRGFPKNASNEIEDEYRNWGLDAHSASYMTLQELINNVEKYKVVKRSGFVSSKTYNEYVLTGVKPQMWCGCTTDPNYKQLEWEDTSESLTYLIKKIKNRMDDCWFCYTNENPENVRIVFWFDN